MTTALKPWHLWGSSLVLDLPNNVPNGGNSGESKQLARLAYNRPETWCFFFGARLSVGGVDVTSDLFLTVQFDLQIGVGRSVFRTDQTVSVDDAFCLLRFRVPAGVPFYSARSLYTSTVRQLVDQVPPEQYVNSDRFVAQDGQCGVRAFFNTPTNIAPAPMKVEATAFFAPLHHARPDWYLRRFDGEEIGGK